MPVDFLSPEQVSALRPLRRCSVAERAGGNQFFFLDDVDKALVERRRGDANRLGLSTQLGTVRCLRTFLPDPLDVPISAVEYVAAQLGVGDPSAGCRITGLSAYGDHSHAAFGDPTWTK